MTDPTARIPPAILERAAASAQALLIGRLGFGLVSVIGLLRALARKRLSGDTGGDQGHGGRPRTEGHQS